MWNLTKKHWVKMLVLGIAILSIEIMFPWETTQWIYTTIAGLIIALLTTAAVFWILPYIPFAIESLANNPNSRRINGEDRRVFEPSEFGFFTALQPGQVKIVERGDRFIRCIMRYDGHTFAGLLDSNIPRNSEKYWEVTKTPEGEIDAHPIPKPGSDAAWWRHVFHRWCLKVYDLTGYVFTGIYPFQTVRVYPMDRYYLVRADDGAYVPHMKEDYSDHYRVEDFQFPVAIKDTETQDKVEVDVLQNFIGRTINPYEVAYSTDDNWSFRLMSSISNATTEYTRRTPIEEILSSADEQGSRALKQAVLSIDSETDEDGIRAYGLRAINTYILNIRAPEWIMEELGQLATAKVKRDADKERAVGEAAKVREFAKAAKAHGENGAAALHAQTQIQTAQAAGDKAIVFLGDPNRSSDPMVSALLKEQREKST